MPIFGGTKQATMYFQDGVFGWSEGYIFNSIAATYEQVMTAADNLATARQSFMQGAIVLEAIKVSDLTIRGDSFLKDYERPASDIVGAANKLAAVPNAERPYSTLIMRIESTPTYHAQKYLSGMPNTEITDPFRPSQLSAGFQTAFQKFADILTGIGRPVGGGILPQPAGPWSFITHDLAGMTAHAKTFKKLYVTGDVQIDFDLVNDPGLVEGDILYILQLNMAKRLVGSRWSVFNTSTLAGVVTYVLRAVGESANAGVGKVLRWGNGTGVGLAAKYDVTLSPITRAQIRGATHHNRGRPFGSPVGRRKKTVA